MKGRGERIKIKNVPAVRASISFPSDLYETLDEIAKQKKVSLAWVVRDAAEKCVGDPTLAPREKTART
jgi:metal-responsive CopG/Arc/MetJ family transcriptional regulator